MELLILGLALGVGAAKRKEVTKAVVKGYMAVSEKTKEVTAHLKEDMRDAVAEARHEQDMLVSDAPVAEMDTPSERVMLHEEEAAEESARVTAAAVAAASVEATRKVKTGLLKGLAKSYLTMTEKTRSAVAQMREEMRDAVEEARFEREHAATKAEATAAAEPEVEVEATPEPVAEVVMVDPTPAKRKRRTTTVKTEPATSTTTVTAEAPASVAEVKPPAKRRGRPPAVKPAAEAAPVKTTRRTKPKATKTVQIEVPASPLEGVQTAVEVAELAATLL